MQTTTLSLGTHTITADYAANGNFGASSGSAPVVIVSSLPALGGMELLALAMVLAFIAMRR
jgi:hypothetical protein